MAFKHPLARGAQIWVAKTLDNRDHPTLVIVTTIALDASHKNYKRSLVEKLSGAARDYLAETKEADAYVLVNRLRDWKARGT
ncbi:MAG TPA: hypothetical protein VMI72_12595 [Roseiarcus sp.]|nr:hypothetical protein [Roseiarcus sp.]